MTVYLTADPHLDHADLLIHCNRPFKYIKDWNRVFVENWNAAVEDHDEIFVLGDFHMSTDPKRIEYWVKQLRGKKHLILGNHDRLNPFAYVDAGFLSVHTALWLIEDKILLAHDPSVSNVLNANQILLCGHVHNLFDRCKNAINVGVDVRNFRPVSLDNLREEYEF